MNDFDPWALLKNAWVAIAALAGFIFKRHLDEDAKRAEALAQVQQTYATRSDIAALHQKIDANHRDVMNVLTRD
jgi:arginine/lysine/ornithine decarboxylase